MKVNELKAELQARGLDTKGVKAQLIERLKEAMEKESGGGGAEVSTPTVAASKKLDVGTPNLSTPVRRSRRRSMTRSPSPVKTEVTPLDSVSEEPEQAEQSDSTESSVRKKRRTRSITKSPSPVKPSAEKRLDVLEEEEAENTASPANSPQKPAAKPESPTKAAPVTPTKPATPVAASPAQAKAVTTPTSAKKQQSGSPQVTPEKPKVAAAPPAANSEPEKMVTEEVAQPAEQSKDAPPSAAAEDADVANASATDSLAEGDNDKNGNEEEEAKVAEGQSADTSVDKGKSDAENKDSNNKPKKEQTPIEFVSEEVEPDIDGGKFALSWFDSHLNLEINPKTFDTAKPISDGALAMTWAGARANLGVRQGKVAYEVLLTQANTAHRVTDEAITAEFRAGWSTADADLQLGESKHSFAYGSDGHKGTDCTFTEYGAQYKVNDVIGVYLDLESSPCKIEYTVNGTSQGIAFEFESADLNGQALFPHVYSKNIAFKVNFGQLERSLLNDRQPEKAKEQPKTEKKETKDNDKKEATEATSEESKDEKPSEAAAEQTSEETKPQGEETKEPESEPKPDTEQPKEEEPKVINPEYIYVAETAKENLTAGITRPENRSECEVIFMIGMPGCGKTHWVKNYLSENSDKKYTVLSVDALLNQMKVAGKPRLPSNTSKWSKLVDTLGKNLNKLNDIAAKRRRNFILDQTNTFASEQKRRLRGFGGYAARRAIVVIPDDEEYNRRLKQKQETYGVEVLEGQVNIMKAHFFLPTLEQGWFTEIKYVELEEEKAREVVDKLNEVGRKLAPRGGYNRNQQFQQNRRGAGNNQQRWNQGYGNNRFGGGQQYQQGGGYNAQNRYNNNAQQYSQNRNYRPGNGYGRQGGGGGYGGGARYGNNDWTRNNTGSYDNRFNNRGYQNSRARGYDRNRGYNNSWNQQNSNSWGYGSQNNDTQQWYSWWQSNLKNLLQQQGGNGSDNAQQSNMQQYWSQYAQQHNYGNYQQSKSHGSGGSSKNK